MKFVCPYVNDVVIVLSQNLFTIPLQHQIPTSRIQALLLFLSYRMTRDLPGECSGNILHVPISNTVNIGFCDQPPSGGLRSLNTGSVAKASGFPLGIATRRSLKAIFAQVQTHSTGYCDQYRSLFT